MPNDFGAQGGVVEDGSIEAAAALMPDLGPSYEENNGLEPPRQRQPRDPQSQQWRPNADEPPPQQNRRRDQVEQETATEDGEDNADEVSAVDDEFFEVEVERDGKPVKERLKASEVWQRAQEADRVRQEFEDYRKNAIPPEQWDQGILQVHQARQQLMQQLQTQRMMLQPEQPDPNLLNPESPRYNPELYGRQMIAAQQMHARVQGIEHQMRSMQHESEQQMQALTEAQKHRERVKLQSFWPEVVTDGKEAARVRDEAIKHWGKYGVSDELINSVHNAAFYAILKDAIAFRRGQQAREAAVKVVRAKPKLVRAQARDTQNPINRRSESAFQRLRANPNDMDAAAASLDGLIS